MLLRVVRPLVFVAARTVVAMADDRNFDRWVDKLEIRELIERSCRHIDDGDAAALANLFEDDGVLQLAGTVFAGRAASAGDVRGRKRSSTVERTRRVAAPAREHAPHHESRDRRRGRLRYCGDRHGHVRAWRRRSLEDHAPRALPRPTPPRRRRAVATLQPHRCLARQARRGGHRRRMATCAGAACPTSCARSSDPTADGQRASVERMAVAEDWNMPPMAWVSDVVTPSTCAAASPRSWRIDSCSAYMPYIPLWV